MTNIVSMILESDSTVFITLQQQEGIEQLAPEGKRETTDDL